MFLKNKTKISKKEQKNPRNDCFKILKSKILFNKK